MSVPRLLPFDLETFSANDKDRPDFVRMIGYKLGGGDVKLALEPDEPGAILLGILAFASGKK